MNEKCRELLLRAADKLNDYSSELFDDLNDSLAEEIERYIDLEDTKDDYTTR